MKPRSECIHTVVQFNSGDYYIHCVDCGAKWVAHNSHSSEYGTDANGKHIGADPSVCIPPGNGLSGHRRYSMDED